MNKPVQVLGLMSGSSMDGIDLAICEISEIDGKLSLTICETETVAMPEKLREKLANVAKMLPREYYQLEVEYSKFLAHRILDFLDKTNSKIDLLAVHGHTVLHNTEHGISGQLGHGGILAELCKASCVSGFRTQDMCHGGKGAPMAVLIDKNLFSDYTACINLGGIANASIRKGKNFQSFDICGFNQVLNSLAAELGFDYDEGGKLSEKGSLNSELLEALNAFQFLSLSTPKALDNKGLRDFYFPVLQKYSSLSTNDKLRTFCQHAADALVKAMKNYAEEEGKILCSGGGAYHDFFLELLAKGLPEYHINRAEEPYCSFKESALIALAGYLRWKGEPNFIPRSSGAKAQVSAGALYICHNEKK